MIFMSFLVLVYSIFFAFLSWRNMKLAIALIVFALPSYLIRFEFFGVPMTVLEAMILILFGVWAMGLVVQKAKGKGKSWSRNEWRTTSFFGGYGYLILLFLTAATVSVFVSSDRVAALGVWKAYFIEPVLFFIVFVNVMKSRRDLQLIFGALSLSALVVAVPAIVQKFTAWGIVNPFWADEETRRVVSWYGFPNAVGLYLAPIVVMMIGWWWLKGARWWDMVTDAQIKSTDNTDYGGDKGDRRKRVVASLILCFVVLLSMFAIIFARSEGAMVGVAAGIAVLALSYFLKKVKRLFSRLVSLLILLVALVSIVLFSSPLKEKLTFSDLSGQIRVQQWKETWNVLKDGRILTGAGLSGYQSAVAPYHQEGIFFNFDNDPNFRESLVFGDAQYKAAHWQPTEIYLYPHNIFLNFWSEIGLFGLIAMLLIVGKFFLGYLRTEKESRPLYLVLISVMIAMMAHGLVDVPYFKNDLSMLVWLFFGMGAVMSNTDDSSHMV